MTALSQIFESNEKNFNIRRIFVQKNCLQILMGACKPLEWPQVMFFSFFPLLPQETKMYFL